MKQQINELNFILEELAKFAESKPEALERGKLAPLVWLEKYRLKETVKIRQKVGYLIVDGECRVSCKRREVILSSPNCLAISRYFQ